MLPLGAVLLIIVKTFAVFQRQTGDADIKGRHTDIKGEHTDIKGGHTDIKGGHTDIKGRHTDIKGRDTSSFRRNCWYIPVETERLSHQAWN